jgi:hypothetical protein
MALQGGNVYSPLNFNSTIKVCIEKIDLSLKVCSFQNPKVNSSTQPCDSEDLDLLNSPFREMPPPSTPAQKEARRGKRKLQLEQWKHFEVSSARRERYINRQKKNNTDLPTFSLNDDVPKRKKIKWKSDLVQTFIVE